jgi:phosphoribosylamine--glycine ligase
LRILIVGSGGREHALAWKLIQSPSVDRIFVAPGNGGTALIAENLPVGDDDIPGLTALAREKNVDLVVAGPELPLVLGLADALERDGIACFGPGAFAAQLEGSKAFAKTVMREAGVPTADFRVFDDYDEAKEHVMERAEPMVVKADGLAAGKGVIVCKTRDEALEALDMCMVEKKFGEAGERVVVEDALSGEEASFLAFCDGDDVLLMPSSQDHKPVGEGDTGPNTGGMGAYSPAPILPESDYEKTANMVIRPIVRALADAGNPFVGILYAGLMYTDEGPMVLEYNVRFGDPECQPLMARLDSDLAELMMACVEGRLSEVRAAWKDDTSICVVMAAEGYPGSYPKGMEISGLDEAEEVPGVTVFQAGTKLEDGVIKSSGGRILGVTALGADLADAKDKAYRAVDKIDFENKYYRRDIGDKGLKR